MRGRITIQSVKSLRPGETLKDSSLIGFEVRARKTARTYSVLYRAGRGRSAPQKRFTIGRHGKPWTPEEARTDARRILRLVALGHDPAGDRAEARQTAGQGQNIAANPERLLSLAQVLELPSASHAGVYFLILGRRVQYVGQSTNVFVRVVGHQKSGKYRSIIGRGSIAPKRTSITSKLGTFGSLSHHTTPEDTHIATATPKYGR